MATSLLPLLLHFLADVNDEAASAVFPFTLAILTVYKKEKKRALPMTPAKRLFLTELLRVSFQRMEYGPDAEWALSAEGEEDDAELAFAEMRKVRAILFFPSFLSPR